MPFDPAQPYATYANDVGNIYKLQGGTYYDPNGNAVNPLPATWPPSTASQPVWQSFTTAQLPAASGFSGYVVFVSDWGVNGTLARSNGVRWNPIGGQVQLRNLGAASAAIANVNTIVLQGQTPIGLLQATDELRFDLSGLSKSGTTDTMTVNLYGGSTGTTSDTLLLTGVPLVAANQTISLQYAFKVLTNTSVQRVGPTSIFGIYNGPSANALPAAITGLPDMSTTSLIFSVAILSSGTTDTVVLRGGRILQIAG